LIPRHSQRPLPPWLTEGDLDFYTEEFKRTGFRGGLNWYRNIDKNWELTPSLSGAKLRQPSIFVAGELDAGITTYREDFDAIEATMPSLSQHGGSLRTTSIRMGL
jgi:hypothetical protein